ncbi:MAG: TlpA disulfide reductase family protein [Pyrinomonadaceae bacterium]
MRSLGILGSLVLIAANLAFGALAQQPIPTSRQSNKKAAPFVMDADDKTGPSEIRQIDLEGLKKLLQRDAKDARPLLVNFWATWCDPCREEFPDLVKIDEDYGAKNLNFVTVSLDDVSEIGTEVPKFLKLMKATMPTVLLNVNDPEPAIKSVDAGWDGQLPATFLYDKDGKVVFRHFGKIKPDELRAAIDKQVGVKQ